MMLCPPMSSPPLAFGRQSSPLNPYSDRSSSPVASTSSRIFNPSSPTPMSGHRTRYQRPEKKKYLASAPAELFAEGTTPMEGQMWRETFHRRVQERERRRQSREAVVDKRRESLGAHIEEDDEEKAKRVDEEIFSRIMRDQREQARHAAEAAYERENGGSDPISPEFWEEQERQDGIRAMPSLSKTESTLPTMPRSKYQTPPRPTAIVQRAQPPRTSDGPKMEPDEDFWALEAAKAEEAEREAEEAELARQIEEEMLRFQRADRPTGTEEMDIDIDMDWDMDSQ